MKSINIKEWKSDGSNGDLVSMRGLADFLGVNLVTLWRYRRMYNLPEYHCGRTILFRISEVLEKIRVN